MKATRPSDKVELILPCNFPIATSESPVLVLRSALDQPPWNEWEWREVREFGRDPAEPERWIPTLPRRRE